MDCKWLDELQTELERAGQAGGAAFTGEVRRARAAATALFDAGRPALAAESLTGAALAALVVSGEPGPEVVGELARSAERLTDADAAGIGLLALGDPLLLSAPLDDALRAHTALLAGLSGSGAATVWQLTSGELPTPAAHAGILPESATRRSVTRALCGDGGDPPAVLVRAFGEPRAMLAWAPVEGRDAMMRALAARSAELLTLSFERAVLLDGTVAHQASLARSAERRLSRVGLDLHDGPLQDVALLRGELSALHGALADGAGSGRDPLATVEDLMAIAEATEADLRELARSMESASLLRRPLDESLRGVVRAFALRTGIEPGVQLHGDLRGLTNMERVALLRMTGEALANAREHSGASAVDVSVTVGETRVVAFVRDDGRGFNVERALPEGARRGSIGLLGMMERARLLGGTCKVQSQPGAGTAVTFSFDRYFPAAAERPVEPVTVPVTAVATLRVA